MVAVPSGSIDQKIPLNEDQNVPHNNQSWFFLRIDLDGLEIPKIVWQAKLTGSLSV